MCFKTIKLDSATGIFEDDAGCLYGERFVAKVVEISRDRRDGKPYARVRARVNGEFSEMEIPPTSAGRLLDLMECLVLGHDGACIEYEIRSRQITTPKDSFYGWEFTPVDSNVLKRARQATERKFAGTWGGRD